MSRTIGVGMLSVTAMSVAFAAPISLQVDVTSRTVWTGDAMGQIDSTFVPFSFNLFFDIADSLSGSYGPVTDTFAGPGVAYDYTFAQGSFGHTLSLEMSPFIPELRGYNTVPAVVTQQSSSLTYSQFVDYSIGGSDFGEDYFSAAAQERSSTCPSSGPGPGESCQSYYNTLHLSASRATTGPATSPITIPDVLATLEHATFSSFFHEARTVTRSNLGYTEFHEGAQYAGTFRLVPPGQVQVPEPGTLALLGLGLVGAGFTHLRRRRNSPAGR